MSIIQGFRSPCIRISGVSSSCAHSISDPWRNKRTKISKICYFQACLHSTRKESVISFIEITVKSRYVVIQVMWLHIPVNPGPGQILLISQRPCYVQCACMDIFALFCLLRIRLHLKSHCSRVTKAQTTPKHDSWTALDEWWKIRRTYELLSSIHQSSTRIRFWGPLCFGHDLNNWRKIRSLLYLYILHNIPQNL